MTNPESKGLSPEEEERINRLVGNFSNQPTGTPPGQPEPAPAQPVQPVSPVQPVPPVEPVQPVQPDPVPFPPAQPDPVPFPQAQPDPVQPVQPEPVAPVQPDPASFPPAQPEPVQPVQPAPAQPDPASFPPAQPEPVVPVQPAPAQPDPAPFPPAQPEPVVPVQPDPAQPDPAPFPPAQPEPVAPVQPKPAIPVQPAPVQPEPVVPPIPVQPDPVAPAQPYPAAPTEPDNGYQPAYEIPAYQSSIGAPATTVEQAALPEAVDLLFAVAKIDQDSERQADNSQMLDKMRKTASENAPRPKSKDKVKLSPLPFEMLIPGTPLIATVYSPSGGVGKSSTAMNLAAFIAAVGASMAGEQSRGANSQARVPRVLVVDGDIVQGSLALRLTGDLTPSIHTLQLYIDERTDQGLSGDAAWPQYYSNEGNPPLGPGEKTMRDFVHWHKSLPNLNLLAAPEEPDLFWDFGPEEYRHILRMLSKFYDVIIIDTGTDLVLESQRAWLAHANEVFIVTAPENDRLYNASKAVQYMISERPHPQDHSENPRKLAPLVTPDKMSVVMTRCDADSGLEPVETIEEIFPWLKPNQKFFVPDFSQEILRANNRGEFLTIENARYAVSIEELAQRIFQRYAAVKAQRTLPSAPNR